MKIELIKQEEECGCVIACLAMITGRTYQQVAADFSAQFDSDGMDSLPMFHYLADFGFQVVTKQAYSYHQKDFYRDELTKPFADVHIMNVKPYFDAKLQHSVVMDASGAIFCPAEKTDIKTVYGIDSIVGIFR